MSMPPPGNVPPPPGPGSYAPPPAGGFGASQPPGYQAYPASFGAGPSQFGEVAGFGVRLGSYLLDGLLYGLLTLPFLIPGIVLVATSFGDCVTEGNRTTCSSIDGGSFLGGLGLMFLGGLVVFAIYVWQLGRTGQTWGRKIVGLKVLLVSNGQPLGIGKAIGRTLFAWFISAQVFYLGYLWMLWDDKQETWHDKVVGSQVFRA